MGSFKLSKTNAALRRMLRRMITGFTKQQRIRNRMPTVKHVMTAALIATAVLAAPAGHADPDPHKPDVGANYCPGGATPAPEATCDGVPYGDGSFWRATQRGAPGTSGFVVVQCVKPAPPPGPFAGLLPQPQPVGPLPAPPGSCGQGG
jgi:hypothetical protein